jgi:hypothetical protein
MCLGMSDHRKQRYIVLAIELMKTLGSFAHHLTVPLTRVWTVKAGDKRLLRVTWLISLCTHQRGCPPQISLSRIDTLEKQCSHMYLQDSLVQLSLYPQERFRFLVF